MAQTRRGWKHWLAVFAITLAAIALFLLLRPDVGETAVLEYRIRVQSAGVIRRYLSSPPVHKLQIGAGTVNKAGWLNTDIEPMPGQAFLDASKRFPLPDAAFRYVYSEHVIEHLPLDGGRTMLTEVRRVLAQGGKVRIATPNLLRFVELFQEGRSEEANRYIGNKLAMHGWPDTSDPECLILNLQLREWGHQFVYTPKMLKSSLEQAGFRDIRQYAAGESDDPEFRGIESREALATRGANAYETMAFEATK